MHMGAESSAEFGFNMLHMHVRVQRYNKAMPYEEGISASFVLQCSLLCLLA